MIVVPPHKILMTQALLACKFRLEIDIISCLLQRLKYSDLLLLLPSFLVCFTSIFHSFTLHSHFFQLPSPYFLGLPDVDFDIIDFLGGDEEYDGGNAPAILAIGAGRCADFSSPLAPISPTIPTRP